MRRAVVDCAACPFGPVPVDSATIERYTLASLTCGSVASAVAIGIVQRTAKLSETIFMMLSVERGIEAQRRLLQSSDSFDEAEIAARERDLRELDEAGRYLSSLTSFLYIARKPG